MKPLKEFVQGSFRTIHLNLLFKEGAEIVQKPLENTESWVAYVMNALSTWLVNQPQQPEPQREYNEKELWQDWEWILSKTEVIIQSLDFILILKGIRYSQTSGRRSKNTKRVTSLAYRRFRDAISFVFLQYLRPSFLRTTRKRL